jgi:hydroxylaminobenzene mutase
MGQVILCADAGDTARLESHLFYSCLVQSGIAMVVTSRNLMSHGMLLFVLGLLTGFAEQHFVNMRMALAAHLEGILNGIFLLALGAAWNGIRLSPRTKSIAYWTVLYGTYANWLFTTLAAVFGTAALSPITAAGHSGTPWQEKLVTAGFLTVAIAILSGSVLLFAGFRASSTPKAIQTGTGTN